MVATGFGEQGKRTVCKAHIKDICYTRMYITGHFDAPFESYRLDAAVCDLASGTGVPRDALLPLTCFLFKGYLWTLNNRRLWVLRHAFMFTGQGAEIDVTVLGEGEMPERKDYVERLQFHKQEALASPKFEPVIHGDQPKLQRLIMRPVVFRFDLATRSGYKVLPGGRLLCINASEAATSFQATAPRPPQKAAAQLPLLTAGPGQFHDGHMADDDDTKSIASEAPSLGSVDFPGNIGDFSRAPSSRLPQLPRLNLGTLKEADEREEEEGVGEEREGKGLTADRLALREVASKFKDAVSHLRVVLDSLDEAIDKLAA